MIYNDSKQDNVPLKAEYCNTFFKKFMGLMFRSDLMSDEALLFVESRPDRLNTAIHMFFMRFPIAVIWLDPQKIVVDAQIAKLWPPFYFPQKSAQFTIETKTENLSSFSIGDQIRIEKINPSA
jgi:uncharacterized protein